MLGDLAVRVCGCHFLFCSAYPAQLPQRQTGTKQEAAPTDLDCEINKHSNKKMHPRLRDSSTNCEARSRNLQDDLTNSHVKSHVRTE